MLVLTRKIGELVRIGDAITVRVLAVRNRQVSLGFVAPTDVKIYREAGHGFMNKNDEHPVVSALGRPLLAIGYQREAAEDAWLRIGDFFAKYLDGSPLPPE